MLFNSVAFLLFFPIVCLLYYCIPSNRIRERNIFLLLVSYYYYMNWEPVYAILLLACSGITYGAAWGGHFFGNFRKTFLVFGVVLNLLILFFFKYFNFVADNVVLVLEYAGVRMYVPDFKILLPIGISFYIFKALGYMIDVYRGDVEPEKNFIRYALFVSFFPQLVAGPIERSYNLLPQFKEIHRFDYNAVMAGINMMIWGYFLKLVLADRCGIYVDSIFNNVNQHNGGSYLVASFLFPFQIYGDFAGYSLIAIGAAKVMGFDLKENFRRPYLSCSVGEFWHRWHISLSTWFRDYLYIPLGGNRVGKLRNYFNLFVTFVVSGIWHGANWTFLCWGELHGILLCIEKALKIGKKNYTGLRKFCHWAATFVLVSFAWILFRANSIEDAGTIIKGIFFNIGIPKPEFAIFLAIIFAMIIMILKELGEEYKWGIRIANSHVWVVRHLYIVMMIAYILLFGVLGGDQFIYLQF